MDAITKAEAKGECNVKVMLTASGSAYPPSESEQSCANVKSILNICFILAKTYTEDDEYGDDFGGKICQLVESAAKLPPSSKVRSVYMRIGIGTRSIFRCYWVLCLIYNGGSIALVDSNVQMGTWR